ncbi:MAG: hypothetical protein JO157_14640, partial [Acetobacteraceae bacterium]|nr:hypothetical protein [Acetobacteraceae bacterium]
MAEPRAFGYHRAIAPMLWAFIGLAAIELVVGHLLIAHWSRAAALVLSALTLSTLIWIVTLTLSLRRCPVVLTDEALVWRLGTLKSVSVPRTAVGGIRPAWDAATIKAPGTLNCAAFAWPNVLVDLAEPVRTRRGAISALAHRLDDPA